MRRIRNLTHNGRLPITRNAVVATAPGQNCTGPIEWSRFQYEFLGRKNLKADNKSKFSSSMSTLELYGKQSGKSSLSNLRRLSSLSFKESNLISKKKDPGVCSARTAFKLLIASSSFSFSSLVFMKMPPTHCYTQLNFVISMVVTLRDINIEFDCPKGAEDHETEK